MGTGRRDSLRGRDIVCFSTADWDTLLPTNKHQLMRRLANGGSRVLFIETLGTRAPKLGSGADLGRIRRRLYRAFSGVQRRERRLWSLSPLVRPNWSTPVARTLNRTLFRLQAAAALRRFPNPIAWVYSPYAVHLLDVVKPSLVVYHMVDDLAAVPGAHSEALREAESRLLARADIVFCTEQSLYDRARHTASHALLMPNVADFDHFSTPASKSHPATRRLTSVPAPRIVFSGNLAHHKVDFALIERCARLRPDWSFVLIGPRWEGTPAGDFDRLERAPNVHLIGHVPYEDLPTVLAHADALVIPYVLNEATTAVFPLKLFEYLATGKPVVASRIPSLEPFEGIVRLADDAPAWIAALTAAMADPPEAARQRQALARRHTWERRLAEMEKEIAALGKD